MSRSLLVNVSYTTTGKVALEFIRWDGTKDIVERYYLPPCQARRVAYEMLAEAAGMEEER